MRDGEHRNLRALQNIIDRWMTDAATGVAAAGHLPEYLASQGVLVVDSLTDDELVSCGLDSEVSEKPMERAEVAAAIRERLNGFARGNGKA